jgi:hypothetical protein
MIKCNKGKMTFHGTQTELRAEMTCLVSAFLEDDDLCEGKTKKERLEWFNEHIVERAYDKDKRAKGIQEAAEEIAKLLGKKTDEILTGILKAMEAEAEDDGDDEDDAE